MSRSLPELRDLSPDRVCLIKPSALGDIVNGFPALSALRARWPEARISWVVNRSLRGLLEGHADLDEVIVYDRARLGFNPAGIVGLAQFLASLRRSRFDLAIDLQGLFRSGLMAAATGASVRVGLADAREGSPRFYTHRVAPPPPGSHAVDRLLQVAAAFGADVSSPRFVVAMRAEDRSWADDILRGVPAPRVVLNVGSRWITKRWPPEHFAEIARRVVETRGAGIVAVGAPEDRPIVEEMQARIPAIPVLDLCGRTTLPQLAAVASASDLFISNDSGPLHLAAAAGAHVVGVYTCTSPELNGPYGSRAVAVRTKVWCAASYLTRCGRLECFAELTPERVWPAVVAQLDAARSKNITAA